jgi:diguanylate cyclase
MGVGIAIDDFGTGYSSLVNLRSLELDAIKIDKSFVIPMVERNEEASIVRSIIELAHNLGLRTIAEGVENLACVEALRALGCDEIQGYVVSTPLQADQLATFLARGPEHLFASTTQGSFE